MRMIENSGGVGSRLLAEVRMPPPRMDIRMIPAPGEKLFVDCSGSTLTLADGLRGPGWSLAVILLPGPQLRGVG